MIPRRKNEHPPSSRAESSIPGLGRRWPLFLLFLVPGLLTLTGVIGLPSAITWNPGTPVWQSTWSILESEQPDYAKKSGHPYLLNRSLAYLFRVKGRQYFDEHLAPYGGAMVFGSSFADKYQPHGFGDAVNHYYLSGGDHAFGCPPVEAVTKELVGYECSYTDAASYADYLYDRAVRHWLGVRRVGLGDPKFDAIGTAVDRDLITSHYAEDNSREKAALYLGWAAHLIQDQTNPYHTTNDKTITATYHAPFEDALDTVIRNGKLRIPLDTWAPDGGFSTNIAAATEAPSPGSIFIAGLPEQPRRPSAIAIDNANNSKRFVQYLIRTACKNDDVLHSGQPCPDFYEKFWGQVMQVQTDRAVKTVAELIAMFLDEVREPTIVRPRSRGTSVASAFGGPAKRVVRVEVDSNPHMTRLILDAKWRGRWHEDLAGSSTRQINFDVSDPSIPEGVVEMRVRACYGPRPSDCTGQSETVPVIIDRTPPVVSMSKPVAGAAFSDLLPVMGFGKDDRSFGISETRIQALFQTPPEKSKPGIRAKIRKENAASGSVAAPPGRVTSQRGKRPQRQGVAEVVQGHQNTWETLAESDNQNVFANLNVTGWPEQVVTLRAQACDRAANCVSSKPIKVRIDHHSIDLFVQSITVEDPVVKLQRKYWPVTVRVRNGGAVNTSGFRVRLRIGNAVFHVEESEGLPGGAERVYSFSITTDPTRCGRRISVTVDPDNEVPELNESNNGKTEARIC
jgi:hypothetical protein